VELIKAAIGGRNEFFSFGPVVVTLFLVGFSILQIHYLNKGLEMFDALYIVPIYQTFWIIGNVIGGITYYQEFSDFDTKDAFGFPVGIIVTLVGVAILSQRHRSYDTLTTPEQVEYNAERAPLKIGDSWDSDDEPVDKRWNASTVDVSPRSYKVGGKLSRSQEERKESQTSWQDYQPPAKHAHRNSTVKVEPTAPVWPPHVPGKNDEEASAHL